MRAEFPQKLAFLFQPKRYKVAWGGRGSAKSWSIARALLIIAAQKTKRILCARELQKSITDSVHKLLCDQIKLLGLEDQYTIQNTTIVHKITGSEFIFSGLRHNIDSLKSMEGIDIVWVEEAHTVSAASWNKLIPTIRKAGSEIWISFNPELETDETYKRFVVTPPTDSIVEKINWRDNPWLSPELIQEKDDLKLRDVDAYLNVWEGHCRQWLDAAVYANELRDLEAQGRLTAVPYRAGVPVSVFSDLGYADFTSLWFVQKIGMNYHVIDFYQDQFQFWPYYLKVLQSKQYYYDGIWLPHDGDSKDISQVDQDKTVYGQTRAAGFKAHQVPDIGVANGINAVRTIFPSLYFDREKCGEGLSHIRRYRYEIRKSGTAEQSHSREPVHDDASHAADALRYLAVGIKEGAKERKLKLPNLPRQVSGSQGWAA
jgi:phage terminase large subunit